MYAICGAKAFTDSDKNIRKNNRCQSWWQREKFDFYTHLRLDSNFSNVKLTHKFDQLHTTHLPKL